MLLPDNIHPENSIYYNSSVVLKELQKKKKQNLLDLYQDVRGYKNISFSIFILCLDWLYLVNLARLNNKNEVELCS